MLVQAVVRKIVKGISPNPDYALLETSQVRTNTGMIIKATFRPDMPSVGYTFNLDTAGVIRDERNPNNYLMKGTLTYASPK